MTHYDKLVDSITNTIYNWYVTGQMDSEFPEELAKRDAHKILEMVEEFQTNRSKMTTTYLKPRPQWRASD